MSFITFASLLAAMFLSIKLSTNKAKLWTNYEIDACSKKMFLSNSFNETKLDVIIGIFVEHTASNPVKKQHLHDSLAWRQMSGSSNLSMKYLIYKFSQECNQPASELFLDILLNATLNEGRSFKIIGTIGYLNKVDLLTLANIMSPYSVPVIVYLNTGSSNVERIQSIQKYYNNIIIISFTHRNKISFIEKFFEEFKTDLTTILYQSEQEKDKVVALTDVLTQKQVCVNVFNVQNVFKDSSQSLKVLEEKQFSNTFLIIQNNGNEALKLIKFLNDNVHRKRILLYDIYENETFDEAVNKSESILNEANIKTDIIVILRSKLTWGYTAITAEQWITFYYAVASFSEGRKFYTLENEQNRNLPISFLQQLILPFLKTYYDPTIQSPILVKHARKIRSTLEVNAIYAYWNLHGNKYQYWNPSLTYLNVASLCSRKCLAGQHPFFIPSKCCGICNLCDQGFFKSEKGQNSCAKCMPGTTSNKNRTLCLPFQYDYYIISASQNIVAILCAVTGALYISFILATFLYYRKTPIVRSFNFKLSVIQLLLHLSIISHVLITVFEQKFHVCMLHSLAGGYILKLIMSIYIVKTNQLLTIFNSVTKLKRTQFLQLKELFFPIVYMSLNILVSLTLFMEYKFKYGIMQTENIYLRYRYCSTDALFYAENGSVILLAIICSTQSFMVRALPANFNETFYIFLGMFTTTIFLLLLLPLDATFNKDGQRVFVNSCVFYFVNIALVSFTYGYKVHILLFDKGKNTNKAIQENTLQAIQNQVRKRAEKRENKH